MQRYLVRQREGTIYASSSDSDRISHMAGPGDVNAGKAWRPVRRPSDMVSFAILSSICSRSCFRMSTRSKLKSFVHKRNLEKLMAKFSLKVISYEFERTVSLITL